MALTAYINATRNLLQLPGANSTSLYSDANLTTFINTARGQVAGEAECIRVIGTIPTVIGQRPYNFSSVALGTPATTGVQGIINVQRISRQQGNGELWLTPRPWPWFSFYELNNAAVDQGVPVTWSQFAQGAAPSGAAGITTVGGGSFYISPPPDAVYTLNVDSVCYPIALVDDTTVEALPYFWTDAVAFFAAYFALMSNQTNARMAEAAVMYKQHYNEFMDRARKQSNPSVNRWQSPQAGDPAQGPKMGLSKAGG